MLDSIGIGIGFARRNWILCAVWFVTGWMVQMDCMGHWWHEVERPMLAGAGTGAPPLALLGQ